MGGGGRGEEGEWGRMGEGGDRCISRVRHHTQTTIRLIYSNTFGTATTAVADPGGFLGFRGTPLFVVLRACVAGLMRP